MESYGAILKKAREDKNLDIETIVRETTITRQYIEALEAEDSSAFPGETYLAGFLCNYADYLGVNKEEVLKLYHAKRIQESPVPAGLLKKQKPRYFVPLVVTLSCIGAFLVAFAIYFFVVRLPRIQVEHEKTVAQSMRAHQYTLTDKGETKRLYKGDQILVPSADGKSNVILTVNDTLGHLSIDTPTGNQIIELSEEREIDINGDGKNELIIYLSDISSTDAARGAEIHMLLKVNDTPEAAVVEVPAEKNTEAETTTTPEVERTHNAKQQLVLEDNRAYPFTVNVTSRGSCVSRYRVDRKNTVEDFYESGETINVTANNAVRLWISNINAVKIQIAADTKKFDLEVGKAGEIRVEDIKWVKDGEGKYSLVVMELD